MPRPLLNGWAARAIVIAAAALVSVAAAAGAANASGAAAGQAQTQPVSLSITSVNPDYARPGKPVTIRGTLTNTSAAPMAGLSVQILSSDSRFTSRSLMQQYVDGSYTVTSPVPGAVKSVNGRIAPGATAGWSITLQPGQLPMSQFGVYPLAAQADGPGGNVLTANETFLPYWPGTKAEDPRPQPVAWIWPLIDQPSQGLCSGLLNNDLAASFGSGGRLNGLLTAGIAYADSAHLTWALDPALLSAAATMSKPYSAGGGDAGCGTPSQPARSEPASSAAAAWLASLKSATSGQPMFVTPYDDADMAALVRNNMSADLDLAFSEGRTVAGSKLDRSFTPTPTGSSPSMGGLAWPADGVANYGVLENLAASDKINTVVLDSSTMPPSPQPDFTPSAQTTTPDGEGPELKVLLSDDTITQVLGSANSSSDSKGTAFAVSQRYLAETAMIAAEQPNIARSIVVAPPRTWNPPAGLASQLLSETVNAPWLKPVSLGQLATQKHPGGQVSRQAPATVSRAELSKPMLSQVRGVEQQVKLLKSIQTTPDANLGYGVAAAESAAWRGGGSAGAQGEALVQDLSGYLTAQEKKLTIIKPPRITLAGLKGPVPVSVSNGLSYPVKVRLEVGPSRGISVKSQPPPMIVPPGQQQIKKVEITASNVGSTTLTLRLLTPQGVALPTHTTVIIQATHYGTLALVIIGAALAIFVLTSATRAFRRGRRARRDKSPESDPGDGAASEDGEDYAEADTVVAEAPATGRPTSDASDHDAAEETDDYAWAPGRAEPR
ncbi:MAG TPA: DUF6049 family protein [Streptosporangiaceae bacterium]|nr:DUF6049 family protein [Streptosporangiaceae bacterium]